MDVTSLRTRYPEFIYESFNHKKEAGFLNISHTFHIPPDITFQPTLKIPYTANQLPDNFQWLVFQLGLIELISYWKATCSPTITIKPAALTPSQEEFWKTIWTKGMGEFFWHNDINFWEYELFNLNYQGKPLQTPESSSLSGSLTLVSGGKDSAVALHHLTQCQLQDQVMLLNPTQAALDLVDHHQISNPITIQRTIDPTLLKLNQQGYLNGHTPFSAYLAFLSLLTAHLYHKKDIIVSNESSANEATLEFNGHPINHQYSKTSDFETRFRKYLDDNLPAPPNYFSFLRPVNELQISQRLSQLPESLKIIRSCNRGIDTNSWCCQCPKCLFTFLMLSPFVPPKQLETIFENNLFTNKSLLPLAQQLVDPDESKPFECVGTKEESLLAFHLTRRQYQTANLKAPYLVSQITQKYPMSNEVVDAQKAKLLNQWFENHYLNKTYEQCAKTIA